MSENDAFEEDEEEGMETEAGAPAEEVEVASRTQGAAVEQHAALGEVREGSLVEVQPTTASGGIETSTSVQEALQRGREFGVGLRLAQGEGTQTIASVSTMVSAIPAQPISSYVRPEATPSAFPSTLGARQFVPLRETAEELSGALEGPTNFTPRVQRPAVPPLWTPDYTAYYGVQGQTVYYVVGFGAAFVHQLTGTFYAWIERTQRFSTIQGYNYVSYWAPEFYEGNTIPGALVDPRLPERVEDLPALLELPNRFLILSQFGPGPASILGTALPMP